MDRAAAAAEKDAEAQRKREEKKALEAEENAAMNDIVVKADAKKNKQATGKLTQAQIQKNMALLNAVPAGPSKKTKKTASVDAQEIQPNMNRSEDVNVSSIEGALKQLEIDPKSGAKFTFKQFEAEMTDKVKEDNPGLKKTQVTEKVFKLWERSPLNPKNQQA